MRKRRTTIEEAYSLYKQKYRELTKSNKVLKKDSDMFSPYTFRRIYEGIKGQDKKSNAVNVVNKIVKGHLANSPERINVFIRAREKFILNAIKQTESFKDDGLRFMDLFSRKKKNLTPEEKNTLEAMKQQLQETFEKWGVGKQFEKWTLYGESYLKKMISENYNITGDWLRWMTDQMNAMDKPKDEYGDLGDWVNLS